MRGLKEEKIGTQRQEHLEGPALEYGFITFVHPYFSLTRDVKVMSIGLGGASLDWLQLLSSAVGNV